MSPSSIIVAPDSFGGWKSAPEVASWIGDRLERAGFHPLLRPMSDGGEGLLDALGFARWLDARATVRATGPTGASRSGDVGHKHGAAVVESSVWLRASSLDPWVLTSRGLGAVLAESVEGPATIGLGGSSTVDMGLGMLAALGAQLLDADGRPLPPEPHELHRLHTLQLAPSLGRHWTVWADVHTPVHRGALLFGPQKGVLREDLPRLQAGWDHVCRVLQRWRRHHDLAPIPTDLPGGGAAGGLGYTLACLGAMVLPGADAIAKELVPAIEPNQLVVTGEGRLDATTRDGKVVAALARITEEAGGELAVVAGSVGSSPPPLPGRLYVCPAGPDRLQALGEAVDALIFDLSAKPHMPARPISARRSRRKA